MTSYTTISDSDLINLLKKEDRKAFNEIYRRYAGNLINFASSKLYSLDDARDLIQDLFTTLWADRHKILITSSIQSYLFTAVRYKVIDKIRKNVTREEYVMIIQSLVIHPDYNPEKELEAKDLKKVMDLAILKLPPRTREIYELSRNEYQSITDIASKLNLSEQTVKNQLTTAMKILREALDKLSVLLL
ncbi:RNA polymerase sigma factor [Pedobacter lusitanus]|uniref:RNA polymerase sigma factor n=1 Tax=Pedobacter lusitanus TaxID=1503925 RepID=UPI000697DEAE|nr:RNA polymerase sigma-70 factor [Pedobacter lusitanus]